MGAAGAVVVAAAIWWWTSTTPPVVQPAPASTSPSLRVVVPEKSEVAELPTGADDALPNFADTVQREAATLAPQSGIDWVIGATRGQHYLLQYVCAGSGQLKITVRGSTGGDQVLNVGCEKAFQSIDIESAGGELHLSARRPGPSAVQVVLQLVALP